MNKNNESKKSSAIESEDKVIENKRQETVCGSGGESGGGDVEGGKRKNCGWGRSGRGKGERGGKDVLKEKLILITSGIATGFANGFFGGGGGMITVPALSKILKYEEKKAHATALLVILPISIFSSISYVVKGSIDWEIAGFVAIGVVVGGIIGAVFLKKISNKALTYLFALIMIAVGVKMFI